MAKAKKNKKKNSQKALEIVEEPKESSFDLPEKKGSSEVLHASKERSNPKVENVQVVSKEEKQHEESFGAVEAIVQNVEELLNSFSNQLSPSVRKICGILLLLVSIVLFSVFVRSLSHFSFSASKTQVVVTATWGFFCGLLSVSSLYFFREE